ncbi:MAG: class I SAM-dependent methyltransferase [bacterium]|nr:class I SAM-dependent methyltransferase [bacterium]
MQNKTLEYYLHNSEYLGNRYESANVADIHQLLLSNFKKESNLLEIGCGSGRDAAFMLRQGYNNLTGIDGTKEMIDMALTYHQELKDHLFVKKLPRDFTFENCSFDGVYSIAVLMHFELSDIKLIINKISEILTPKGRFLFSVPLKRLGLSESGYDEQGRLFTVLSEMKWFELCKTAGFKKISSSKSSDSLGRSGLTWLTCIVEKV